MILEQQWHKVKEKGIPVNLRTCPFQMKDPSLYQKDQQPPSAKSKNYHKVNFTPKATWARHRIMECDKEASRWSCHA